MAKNKLPKVGNWKGNSAARTLKLGKGVKAALSYEAENDYSVSEASMGGAFYGMSIEQVRKLGAGLVEIADAIIAKQSAA